jgi:hypothetical protein
MYIPAKPAPTTTTSQVSLPAARLLPATDGKADIYSRSLEILLELSTSILSAA